MIATILSTALGFGTSFVPKLLDYAQDAKDKSHELKVMSLQLEREEKLQNQKSEALLLQAEIERETSLLEHDSKSAEHASTWVNNLRSSVRPIITYLFFALFFFVEGVAVYVILRDGGDAATIANTLWSEETQSIFAAIIAFWFGSRAIKR